MWSRIALVIALSAIIAATAPVNGDYRVLLDGAGPQIDALVAGDIDGFFSKQSVQGPVSALVRAPFAAAAPRADQDARYRLGVFPCVLAFGLAGLLAAAFIRRRGARQRDADLVIAVSLAAAVLTQALRWGHPEELLAAAMVVASVFAASAGMVVLAGVALGLAIATKAWAALALVPVVLTATRPLRAATAAVLVAVALIAPMVLADSGAFKAAAKHANSVPTTHPADIWWPLSRRTLAVPAAGDNRRIRAPSVPAAVRKAIRPATAVAAAVVALVLYRRRRRRFALDETLALLALVFLVRCLLDPGDNAYYHAPFVLCVIAWEAVTRRSLPVLGALAAVLVSTVPGPAAAHPDLMNALYLAWALPACGYLAYRVAKPKRLASAATTLA